MRRFTYFLTLIVALHVGVRAQSVLASGDWYKVAVTSSGIYKIDRNFLTGLGLNPASMDPATFGVFGSGGEMLPQLNSAFRHVDLPQNAILKVGLQDGTWDANDYVLFYGNSSNTLTFGDQGWRQEKNVYSDTTFYFLSFEATSDKAPQAQGNLGNEYPVVSTFEQVRVHELDETLILFKSGRNWVENAFTKGETARIQFDTPGFLGAGKVYVRFIGKSETRAEAVLSFQNQELGRMGFDSIGWGEGSTYDIKGIEVEGSFDLTLSEAQATISMTLEGAAPSHRLLAYPDQVILSYSARLEAGNTPLAFNNFHGNGPTTLQLNATTPELTIWDVSDPVNVKNQLYDRNSNIVMFGTNADSLARFIAFSGTDFPAPIPLLRVENQNIKALSPADGLIITHARFLKEADRLAQFHRSHDGLDVEVVTIEQVFNEFSSGSQDITAIRDAIRHFYLKSPTFRYALLFGDCSYDYKNRIFNNTNLIPVYQSRNSLDPVLSYSSDDYYGFMEAHEGYWDENGGGDHTLEVGIGRIPVNTLDEAEDVVNKIIRYATSQRTIGPWKNRMTYVVDDGDRNIHIRDAERLAAYLNRYQAQTSFRKLYIDADEQVVTASEQSAPMTTAKLKSAIEEGTFMVNYIGHGSEERWARETVLDKYFIDSLTNRTQLPIFVTATCEFGRYDDPSFGTSGAEDLLLNPNGGAIALLTTTRPVYAFSNYLVNAAFHSFVFSQQDGEYPRLGDLVRHTKNNSLSGPVNRNFALLGDPMLRLAYPKYNAVITEINEQPVDLQRVDTLNALSVVNLSGQVQVLDGSLAADFDGQLRITVFDRESERMTLGQESAPYEYWVQENRLFQGDVSVRDGLFEAEFLMPKNMSYRYDLGKITMYGQTDNGYDAAGSWNNIAIGGTARMPIPDVIAPKVRAFMNDSTFSDGGTVGTSALFIARVTDESGVNASGVGISQDIVLTLDDGEVFVLNDYYVADLDTYKSGTITFPLNNLKEGRHSATLKLWDAHNNSATTTVNFKVSDQPAIRLFNVSNYPNPASGETTITFEHDRPGEELVIDLIFYDMNGALVQSERITLDDSPQHVDGLEKQLPPGTFRNGMYFFKLQVTSTLDGAYGSEIKRLLVFN